MRRECRLVMELGGLVIALFLPLCFNPLATKTSEPVKAAFFHTVVVAVLVAAAISLLLEHPDGPFRLSPRSRPALSGSPINNPLALPVLIYAAAHGLTTITSVDPFRGLRGARENPQGTATLLSEVAFFLLVATALRTTEQLRRMTTPSCWAAFPWHQQAHQTRYCARFTDHLSVGRPCSRRMAEPCGRLPDLPLPACLPLATRCLAGCFHRSSARRIWLLATPVAATLAA